MLTPGRQRTCHRQCQWHWQCSVNRDANSESTLTHTFDSHPHRRTLLTLTPIVEHF